MSPNATGAPPRPRRCSKTTRGAHQVVSAPRTKSGGVLLSQGVNPQVPSALAGLTSVFGMGTGVTLPLWPPKPVVNERVALEDSRASTSVQSKPSAD
jgi:hypothetical protein